MCVYVCVCVWKHGVYRFKFKILHNHIFYVKSIEYLIDRTCYSILHHRESCVAMKSYYMTHQI